MSEIGLRLLKRIDDLRVWLERAARRGMRRATAVLRLALSIAKARLRVLEPARVVYTVGTQSQKEPQKLAGVITAYLGHHKEAVRDSCYGCTWLDNGCNAHEGRRIAVVGKVAKGNAGDTLQNTLAKAPKAKAVRFSAIGEVGGGLTVPKSKIFDDIKFARDSGLAVLGYTHAWRRPENADMKQDFMASVESTARNTELEVADSALDDGWRPVVVLSGENKEQILDAETGKPRPGAFVVTPKGRKLLLCPYYRQKTGCNDCRLCDPQAKAWKVGRYHGIAFVETGRGRRLPTA